MSAEVETEEAVTVDIGEWVERARADPAAYLERQATEVFLSALSMSEPYCEKIFLKGGILMGVVYQSVRQTADIDFTSTLEPHPHLADQIKEALSATLPRAAAELGYPDLICRVQSVRHRPRANSFADASFPALEIRIGYARRGSPQEERLSQGRATEVLYADISFREPVGAIQVVRFKDSEATIRAYSLCDLIAEKLRALLQQEVRNRYRRQDIYDIDVLLSHFPFDEDERARVHALLLEKSRARGLEPTAESLSEPEVIRRAKEEWDTLGLEIGEVPNFEDCFARVDEFYRSLPWGTEQ
ncbi:nucleotidyl transferase AbiEii/AbiGii toxin family protein [Rhodovulum marinum]|uniref:Nucleotidyltransferase AbiEii toxin of type IV toxin-antitoxin system n=1 Tax=Rhodovulum marinum TaxID=320662 RepID=A0A4R2PQK3_9RHOB|nr:nucleotidyl transferase AbiEii/AbiGii toxin family protein [Rhodovulum marinum]TCP38060.1 nucleotidyltransferase AbiEii toxin of type IV toxin-antitoxin system [Rhodovulum marinum]